MTPAESRQRARELVADWPEFTPEQIEALRPLLAPVSRGRRTRPRAA